MVTGIKNYSTTPGDNNSPAPNGFPEGMAPSGVNDAARQVMAEIRKWYEEAEWIDYGHSGLTYVDTTNFRVTGDRTDIYTVGRRVRAIGTTPFTVYGTITASSFSSPNTTITVEWDGTAMNNTLSEIAVSINPANKPITRDAVSGLDAYKDAGELTISSGSSTRTDVYHTVDTEGDTASDDLDTISGGTDGALMVIRPAHTDRTVVIKHDTGNIHTDDGEDITLDSTDKTVLLIYDAELTAWLVLSKPVTVPQSVPTGAIFAFPTATAPTGYLACDGSAVSRTTYAALFALIGDDYGNGDGSTTFNLPDYRGEFLRGFDDSQGNDPDAASRTDRGDGTTGDNVGTKQADEFKSHTHSFLFTSFAAGAGGQNVVRGASAAAGNNTTSSGGNETRPRNVSVLYCIKT